jgi:hypothetical protein
VHFSERQFFDSIHAMGSDEERTIHLLVSHVDNNYPESSWTEIVACFNQLMEILKEILSSYQAYKTANPSLGPVALKPHAG